LKIDDRVQFDKNKALLDKCLKLADEILEKDTSEDEINKLNEDKKLLNEIFHKNLKKNLKICSPLDKDYSELTQRKLLEEELKRTLKVYTEITLLDKQPNNIDSNYLSKEYNENLSVFNNTFSVQKSTNLFNEEKVRDGLKPESRSSVSKPEITSSSISSGSKGLSSVPKRNEIKKIKPESKSPVLKSETTRPSASSVVKELTPLPKRDEIKELKPESKSSVLKPETTRPSASSVAKELTPLPKRDEIKVAKELIPLLKRDEIKEIKSESKSPVVKPEITSPSMSSVAKELTPLPKREKVKKDLKPKSKRSKKSALKQNTASSSTSSAAKKSPSIPKKESKSISKEFRNSLLKSERKIYSKSKISKESSTISKQEKKEEKVKSKKDSSKDSKLSSKNSAKSKVISKASQNTFFSEDIMQKIRFLFFKSKAIEEIVQKKTEELKLQDLKIFHDYINLLNVNYKMESQVKIIRELEINPTFFDPIEERDIEIWDLMLECGRVLCVLAKAYSQISEKYEFKRDFTNAIASMVECSKAYKTAAYFCAACTRQEERGSYLIPENLELKSEEARTVAQDLAIEKELHDLHLSSKLYAGLAALLTRIQYLKNPEENNENETKALIYYYKGKACHLKAKALISSSSDKKIFTDTSVINLQRKANYYFLLSEDLWENLLKNNGEMDDQKKYQLKKYLAAVNEDIMENDVDKINMSEADKIQDPEPFIAVPENLAYYLPKFTEFLTNYPSTVLEKRLLKKVSIEQGSKSSQINKLINQKAGIGRTMKQLKQLYENGDIDIDKFTELYEKYSIKDKVIEEKINQLKGKDKD